MDHPHTLCRSTTPAASGEQPGRGEHRAQPPAREPGVPVVGHLVEHFGNPVVDHVAETREELIGGLHHGAAMGGKLVAGCGLGRPGPPGVGAVPIPPGPPVRGPGARRQRGLAGLGPGPGCFTGGLRPGRLRGLGAACPVRAVP